MADIVNLRGFRKARAKLTRAEEADRNRVKFGVGKAAKSAAGLERERAAKALEGGRLADRRDGGTRGPAPDA